jgi:hypothetical protein
VAASGAGTPARGLDKGTSNPNQPCNLRQTHGGRPLSAPLSLLGEVALSVEKRAPRRLAAMELRNRPDGQAASAIPRDAKLNITKRKGYYTHPRSALEGYLLFERAASVTR